MPKKLGTYPVPFLDGSLQHYVWAPRYGRSDKDIEWRENKPFAAALYLDGMESGRSAKYVLWQDLASEARHPMFVVDLLEMLQQPGFVIREGHAAANSLWAVRKRGQNYGLVFVGVEHMEGRTNTEA